MNPRSSVLVCVAAVAALLLPGLLLLALAVGATVAATGGVALPGGGCGGDGGTGGGSQQIGPRTWSAEQTDNAQTITQIAVQLGLPKRAAVLAIATAIVESQLSNLPYGDADSLGIFQQRPSQGWGSAAQILNPDTATRTFYNRLLDVPGWATLPPGVAEQEVQGSAFPERYAPQEAPAADLVARFWVGPDNPIPPTGGVDDAADPGAAQLASLATLACPDQGGSNLPLSPADLDAKKLPPGFTLPADPKQRAAVSYALAQLGKPYVWGAKGPNAFDCSGLMLAAWAAAGIGISAGTVNQKNDGTPVADLSQVAPGDLLFIPGSLGNPSNPRHVGMYAGHGVIVDAYDTSRGVILEKLSDWQDDVVAIRHITGPGPAEPPNVLAASGATP